MKRFATLAALAALISFPAHADFLNVSGPNIKQGEKTFGIGSAWEKPDGDRNGHLANDMKFEYSPLNWWKVGIKLNGVQEPDDHYRYKAVTVRSGFQFMRQEQGMPLAAAVRIEYEKAHLPGDADAVKARLQMQRNDGNFTTVLNLGLVRDIGPDRDAGLGSLVRASVRYKINDQLVPAIDYIGDPGSLHELDKGYDRQDHRIGPTLRGKLDDGFSYEIGYLAGISQDAPNHSVKLNLGYSFN